MRRLFSRITRLEWMVAAIVAVVLVALVLIEPDILEAPFENSRTLLFTFGGTALAAVALFLMLRFNVAPVIRIVVLGVPFVIVSWWLLSPFFIDDVVDDDFATSIAEARATGTTAPPTTTARLGDTAGTTTPATTPTTPAAPRLVGAGSFVGLAGHDGTGDAGFFVQPDGSYVLRLERFDIENGPDLELYVVPGADRVDVGEGAVHLGSLRGNVGDQTYELGEFVPSPGPWTVLVWCEAFAVEFVGATVHVA